MSTPVYTILSQTQVNKWDERRQEAVEGWNVRVQWGASLAIFTVFVPTDNYNPANVDAAVREQGYATEQVAALGARQPPPAATG